MKLKIVIPARLGSTRLPKKILADIFGKPMLWWTWKRAVRVLSNSEDVILAVDDVKVKNIMEKYGACVELTSKKCADGTARVREVARKISADWIINIQADEPNFSIKGVKMLIEFVKNNKNVEFATLACPLISMKDLNDPNIVKVILDSNDCALYFSRWAIPYSRDRKKISEYLKKKRYLKHIGIYAYKKEFLLKTNDFAESWIGEAEKLEQLKYLYSGKNINVIRGSFDSIGVDVYGDLSKVKKHLRGN
ncbi:MAG: 3-deoxy-manno-octulosonate cytidylyltransferase [bacterium]